jgi:hypothetical protein
MSETSIGLPSDGTNRMVNDRPVLSAPVARQPSSKITGLALFIRPIEEFDPGSD